MPMIFERAFRVRHYECDPYGHVNHTNYLRYMQETAFDAATAAGYSMQQYEEMKRAWFIRETDITYRRPLQYGDTVCVRTWVSDFRRVRSRRMYELINVANGEVVASAVTDWVYVNRETQRPVTVPDEIIAGFWPDGPPTDAVAPRSRFPVMPPVPPTVFTLHKQVQWRDLDPANHVNNAMYVSYFEDCGVGLLLNRGWTMERMDAAGFGIMARRMQVEYRIPAVIHDDLAISTWVTDVKKTTAARHYMITRERDGELLARGHSLWVCVDLKTLRPMRTPADFIADMICEK